MTDVGNRSLLRELINSSKNLPKCSSDIGAIHLSLSEVKRRANGLRKQKNHEHHFTKAHYLLAGSGISIDEIEDEWRSLQIPPSTLIAPAQQVIPDIEGMLKYKKEESILSAIENSLSTASRDFDQFVSENISMDWRKRSDALRPQFNAILQSSQLLKSDGSDLKRRNTTKSIGWNTVLGEKPLESSDVQIRKEASIFAPQNKSPRDPNVSFALRKLFELHAQAIYELNEARDLNKPYLYASVLHTIFREETTESKNRQMVGVWRILGDLVSDSNQGAFAEAYQSPKSPQAVVLRKRIISTSKGYLESQFVEYLDQVYRKSITTLNGVVEPPSMAQKVRVFVETKLKKNGEWTVPNLSIVNGVPIWAILFYLLRAGCIQEAVDVTNDPLNSFEKLEKPFPGYLRAYARTPDGKLPREIQERLLAAFNQMFRNMGKDSDPFRFALYKLIGRCDLSKKTLPFVTLSIEDWLWTHLAFTREDASETEFIHERYSLADLQKSVLQFGPDNFNASTSHPLYLQALVMCGCYELAVEYCYKVSEVNGVHLAIGLAYYGLLNVGTTDLFHTSNNAVTVNLAKLIHSYTSEFRNSDPRVAAEYLILACMNVDPLSKTGKQLIATCHEYIRDLVLDTREFYLLRGKISPDGTRLPGAIEKRRRLLFLNDQESYRHTITEQVALKADEEGRVYDCILLYQLSEEYNTVVVLVNRLLGNLLKESDLEVPLLSYDVEGSTKQSEEIILLAKKLMSDFSANPALASKVTLKARETCTSLLQLVEIRDSFARKDWENCLKMISSLEIIPTLTQLDLTTSRRMAQDLTLHDENIVVNVPHLLVIAMTCVVRLVALFSASEFTNDSSKETKVNSLKAISKNCMIYAGMLQYKMPSDTFSVLMGLESML